MAVIEICQEIEPEIKREAEPIPDPVYDYWDPKSMDAQGYFESKLPDDRLTALGVRPLVASAIIAMACSPETVRPDLARQAIDCLGFLSIQESIVGPWAKPVLDELGVNGLQLHEPTQAEFERGLAELMLHMERLDMASR